MIKQRLSWFKLLLEFIYLLSMSSLQKFKTGLIAIIPVIMMPILVINLFGGIFSGIWLAILGEWGEIGRGILLGLVSTFAISFALMPSLIFTMPALWAMKRGKKFIAILSAAGSAAYVIALISFWCLFVLGAFVSSATDKSIIPMLIWSYGVALGPWIWLAQKDQQTNGNEYSVLTTLFAEFSYLIAMVLVLFGVNFGITVIAFCSVMLVDLVLQITFASVVISNTEPEDQIQKDGNTESVFNEIYENPEFDNSLQIDNETVASLFGEDGHILFYPVLRLLDTVKPENRLEFVKSILKFDPSSDEWDIDEKAQFVLDEIDGKHQVI